MIMLWLCRHREQCQQNCGGLRTSSLQGIKTGNRYVEKIKCGER